MALEALEKIKALELNINASIIDDQLQGDIPTVSEYLVETQKDSKMIKTK